MFIIILYVFILLSAAIMFISTPYITRKTEQFGVSIPQKVYYREDMKKKRKQYAIATAILSFIIICNQLIIFYFSSEMVGHITYIANLFIFIFLSFFIYLYFHKQMKQIKENENWIATKKQMTIIDTSFHQEKTVYSSWLYVIPFFIMVATIVYTFMMYAYIPNKLPMHTSFNGDVRYDEKTIFNVLFMPGVQLFMIGMFLFIHKVIARSKQQISVENPEVSKLQNKFFRKKWSLYLFFMALLMVGLFTFIQLTFIHPGLQKYENIVTFVVIAVIFIGTIALSFRTGQGGSRIKVDHMLTNDNVIDRDDDQYWKLGQFYFNKNDPSIFIEKRFSVGWTNNWANPISWIFVCVLLIVAVGIPLLITYL